MVLNNTVAVTIVLKGQSYFSPLTLQCFVPEGRW